MRDIKFSILLQHDETGRIVERVFSYADIFNGTAKAEIDKLKRYAVIARREYTGLTDKNGKDIYEGDIVRWKIFVGGRVGLDEEVRYVADVVEFSYGAYATRERYQYLGTTEPFRELEIIGNIYENPELLEDEGDPHA